MLIQDILHFIQNQSQVDTIIQFLGDIILPIVIAVLTYIAVNSLGEWKKRRNTSLLGVVIIESLQEEVRTGINLMTRALEAAKENEFQKVPKAALPDRSWGGMTTIPDEVLLRIIATSADKKFDGLPPREIRTHCKNYFEFMKANYSQTLENWMELAKKGEKKWKDSLSSLLAADAGHYIKAARGVYEMLEITKDLLKKNAEARFPK